MIHLVNKISGGILILIFGGILVLTGFPRAFGVEPMIVKSGSMEPVISTGSLTYINRRFPVEQIQIGDIIAYQAGNGVEILHRVVAIDGQNSSIRTKGDANDSEDLGVVAFEDYTGKELLSIPYVGYFISGLHTPAAWIGGALLVVMLWALYMVDKPKRVP